MRQAIETLYAALAPIGEAIGLRRDVPMSGCTTLRLGGPADLFCEPADEAQLEQVLTACRMAEVPLTVIGQGSNLLVLDGGVRGLVVRIGHAMKGISFEGETVRCQAGISLPALSAAAAGQGLAGLVFASGIPGTLGGGTVMNAGAYGGELSQVIEAVRGISAEGTPFTLCKEELEFGYRHSALQGTDRIVTSVALRLAPGEAAQLREEMAELSRRRAEKQPLDVPSAGSTFKRPQNGFSAQLIDQCGLKGCAVGGAMVSEKHAGFLVNRGGTSADFLRLMELVQETVERETGIALEPEVRIIGEGK